MEHIANGNPSQNNNLSEYAVQMTGHCGGILSTDFVDRGKNIVCMLIFYSFFFQLSNIKKDNSI